MTRRLLQRLPLLALLGTAIVAFSIHVSTNPSMVLILAPPLAALAIYFAITRFAGFTLIMLAARTSIEVLPIEPPTDVLRASVVLTALYCAAAAVWLLRTQTRERIRPSFLAWGVIAVAGAGVVSAGLSEQPVHAAIGASRWVFLAVFVVAMERLVDKSRPAALGAGPRSGDTQGSRFSRNAMAAIAISMAVPLLAGAFQIVGHLPSVINGDLRISGSLSHPNTFGFYLVVMILGLLAVAPNFSGRARVGVYLLAALATIELAATYSRTSYVALAIGAAVLVGVGRRWALLGAAVLVVTVVSLVPGIGQRWADLDQDVTVRGTPGNALTWRVDYWGEILEASEDRRVTGVGFGVISDTTEQGREPHNDFIRALAEMGALGLIAYLTVLAAIVGRAIGGLRRNPIGGGTMSRRLAEGFAAVSAALLVASLTGNPMTQLVLLWYVFAFAALARPGQTVGRPVLVTHV